MAELRPGDKCPSCREGLIERVPDGLGCGMCGWELEIEEVIMANAQSKVKAGPYTFKPRTFKIVIETPEEGEEFLRGLVLASQNNNSPYFQDLLDAVNTVLQPYREAKLKEELAARG